MLRNFFHLLLLATPLSAEIQFTRDVQPILNKNCIACHGGVKEAGGVSFIFRDQVLGEGESGKIVVVPGKPEESEMIARIITNDLDDLMPKPEHGPRLSEEDVETLRQWIKEGADWGEHWSFAAPNKHEVPSVKNTDWPANDIDPFILARLESENLKPSPVAKPAEWLRRASLDLIGLPPTIAELDAFEAAAKQDYTAAVAAETERLLASPHFGERWASVWMDLARYADSEGLGNDSNRDVWKYRDWIIKSFNEDLPYSQFIIDQLAGDLVPESTLDQKLATVFHRLTQANSEGGTDDEEFRVLAAMDRNVTTWEVFQGLSMNCVQCHSHPYDPIKHEEYYTSLAFFNNARDADAAGNAPMLPIPLERENYAKANELIESIEALEQSIFDDWMQLDGKTIWKPVTELTASSPTAEMSVVEKDGYAEFRATDNAKSGSVYTLDATPSAEFESLSAFRLTYLPKDEKKALTDAEWGASLNHITAQKIAADGAVSPIKLVDVIADEAHPMINPLGSLKKGGAGWGTHYKFFRPRHATFILEEAVTLQPGDKVRLTLKNGGTYMASFPMVAKRGRLAFASNPFWISLRSEPEMLKNRQELQRSQAELKKIPSVRTPIISDRDPEHARLTTFFNRGNWLDKGDVIQMPDTPQVFPQMKAKDGKPDRLDFAKWLASPENPLTARVAVNRFWLELFGVGIVPTPEDFGSFGEKPTHPELLDTLSVQFSTDMNWSIKSLLRKIVTSATYRQSNAVSSELHERDADNRLLARGPRQRLTGEMARDLALRAAGLLHQEVYGKPVYPPLPPGVWKPFVDGGRWKTPEPGNPQRYRRAVYTYWKRSIPYPTFSTFDAPTREMCSKRRMPSNTPIQALAVMNDPAFHECAQELGRRMMKSSEGTIEEKISFGYRATTSLRLTPDRLAELKSLYDELLETYQNDPSLTREIAETPEGAALSVVASVLLNLDESITR
ncbi:MAG: PSD1 and planctomycete cytochrome C domain-containing protein [Akkermansiaceae bacterium]